MEISLCMIVKNEEDVLARCLQSACEIADEIIIVDTGSTDKTKEIAKQFTDKVYDFEWVNDFSRARNYAFSHATKEYTMWLDADDVIEKVDSEKILHLKQTMDKNIDVVFLKYNISFDEQDNPTFFYYRERIVKTARQFKWQDPVHEAIVFYGTQHFSDAAISHKKTRPTAKARNLKIYQSMIENKIPFNARQKFYYSRELMYNEMFEEGVASFKDYFENFNGWIENKIEACLNIAKCYQRLNQNQNALEYLLKSFMLDLPRAEILCELGQIFMAEKKYNDAIYWFDLALKCKHKNNLAFIVPECYDIIPALQICVCYYYLGNIKRSKYYHKKCMKINSLHPAVKLNEEFFKSKNKKNIK